MRLVRLADGRAGLLDGDHVIDVAASLDALDDDARSPVSTALYDSAATGWLRAIEAWGEMRVHLEALLDAARRQVPGVVVRALRDERLSVPLVPAAMLCGGQNYSDHLDEMPSPPLTRAQRDGPSTFLKLPQTVVGPDEPIPYPAAITSKLDFEVELAVVIGRAGHEISAQRALSHVFGYTIINDMTLRDRLVKFRPDGVVVHSHGVTKNFDGAAPLGPMIVTADEIPDPHSLAIRSVLNGVVRQQNNTANMIDNVADFIAYFSRFVTLRPGFVIATGTCGGTGWGMDAELGGKRAVDAVGRAYLLPGDRVECEIERIGTLANTIIEPGA